MARDARVPGELEARSVRQLPVDDEEVEGGGRDESDGLLDGRRLFDDAPPRIIFGEEPDDPLPIVAAIVDDQNAKR